LGVTALSQVQAAAWRHIYFANLLGAALITFYLVVSSPAAVTRLATPIEG